MAEASRKLPIPDAAAILRGRPTAATSVLRLEMGSGLVNALRAPLEQALVAAQDATVAQAVAALLRYFRDLDTAEENAVAALPATAALKPVATEPTTAALLRTPADPTTAEL